MKKIVEKILVRDRIVDGKVYMVFTEDSFHFELEPKLGRFGYDKFVADSLKEQFESKWYYLKDEKVYRSRLSFNRLNNGRDILGGNLEGIGFISLYLNSTDHHEFINFNFGRLDWAIGKHNNFCANCGKILDNSFSKFCANCGDEIKSTNGKLFYMKDFLIPPLKSIEEVTSKLDLASYRNSYIQIEMYETLFKYSVDLSPSNVVKIIENLRILDEKYYNKYLIKTKKPWMIGFKPEFGPNNHSIGFKISLGEKYPSDIYLDKVDGTTLIERQFGKEFSKIENGYEFDDEHRLLEYVIRDYPVNKGDVIYIRTRALDKEISDPLKVEIDYYLGELKKTKKK